MRGENWKEIQENRKWENRDDLRFLGNSQPPNYKNRFCNMINHLLKYMGSAFKQFFLSRSWVDNEEKILESAPHKFK